MERIRFRHETSVTAVAIDPTKQYVAVADFDGRVFLRNGLAGALLGELEPVVKSDAYSNKMTVEALAFDGSGKWLYGIYRDGRLTSWATSISSWIAAACKIANRAPKDEERALYRSLFNSSDACLK
ncbi:MAG TPA: hypothetical protein VGC99_21300 [Candidatus Tectomicrobia bacterium]